MELISIVIPCYNDSEFLESAISSALKIDWENKEIIVVDDGSDNKTKDVINSLSSKIDYLISQKNKGVSIAKNEGIKQSKGEYILIHDADDQFDRAFIKKAMVLMEKSPNAGIVCCHALIEQHSHKIGEIISKGGSVIQYLKKNRNLGNYLLRRKCWNEIGGYDELMLNGYEDWEFNIRVRKNGWKIEVLDEFLFHYRLKDISRDQLANKNYKYELRNYIFLKHQDLFKDNFEEMITYMHNEMNRLEREKQKIQNSLTYKTGDFLISPFKKIWLWIRGIKNGKKVSYISKNSELP